MLGCAREGFRAEDFEARAAVGAHLHVLGTPAELSAAGALQPRYQLRSDAAQRDIVAARGFTARLSVDFELEEVRADADGGDVAAAAVPGDDGGVMLRPVAPREATVSRRWVFETALDARFGREPDWVVVDIGDALGGNEFWSSVAEV